MTTFLRPALDDRPRRADRTERGGPLFVLRDNIAALQPHIASKGSFLFYPLKNLRWPWEHGFNDLFICIHIQEITCI